MAAHNSPSAAKALSLLWMQSIFLDDSARPTHADLRESGDIALNMLIIEQNSAPRSP
jgi:hypothetical protein